MNYPDTRNKLDNQKNIQPKKRKPTTAGYKNVEYAVRINNLAEISKKPDGIKIKTIKFKESNGSKFKKAHGFSKSTLKAAKRNDLNPVLVPSDLKAYKLLRKERKLAVTKARQLKHAKSVLFKRTNGKKKGASGKTKAPVTKETK